MQKSGNIIYQHTTAFGNTGNDCFGHLQSIDNQYLYFCKTLSYFTGFDREKDSLRLNPQSEGLCGARLTSPLDLFTRFYYFGTRYYDPALSGLFISVDQMADKYPNLSPYAYCAWNPVKLVDQDGMELTDFKDANGNLIKHIEDGSDAVFVLQNALWDADKNKMVNENGIQVKPSNAFFKFSKGTSDNINIETVINFSQEFCKDNYTNDDKTYCNYAAGFVIKSFVSASESKDMKVDGDMSMFFYDNGRVKPAGNIYTNIKPNALYDDAVRLANERDNRHAYLSIGCFNGHIVTFTCRAGCSPVVSGCGGSAIRHIILSGFPNPQN